MHAIQHILVTGATGFVGRHLCPLLARRFPDARLTGWCHTKDLPDWSSELAMAWQRVDITDSGAVASAIAQAQPSHVVHLAALSHVPTAIAEPERAWSINTLGTLHLLRALAERCPRSSAIHVSSSDIYGRSFRADRSLDETALLQPENPYSASKAAADLMARQYGFQGLKTVCLRPFNHIGPGQREDFVFAAFARQIARIERGLQNPVLKVGNLEASRDFTDVRDIAEAYAKVIEQSDSIEPATVFNISSDSPRRISSVLDNLIAAARVNVAIEQDPSRMRPSDTPFAAGDSRAIRAALGWQPRFAWRQTIDDILNEWRARTGH